MYTVDYLHLKTEALKPKKKKLLRTTEKRNHSTCMQRFLNSLHGNSALPLTREENEAETHF